MMVNMLEEQILARNRSAETHLEFIHIIFPDMPVGMNLLLATALYPTTTQVERILSVVLAATDLLAETSAGQNAPIKQSLIELFEVVEHVPTYPTNGYSLSGEFKTVKLPQLRAELKRLDTLFAEYYAPRDSLGRRTHAYTFTTHLTTHIINLVEFMDDGTPLRYNRLPKNHKREPPLALTGNGIILQFTSDLFPPFMEAYTSLRAAVETGQARADA